MATRAKLFSQLAKSVDTSGTITSAGISSTVSLGATVYDSAGQLPTSGYNAGDQAFVISTSRLYINSGVGWYNVAVINNTPIVQSVLDSAGGTTPFSLATDGTPTTITINAVDSDGDPLTYSSTADSDFGGLATISQADNVFTITPLSQDSATTESGTITFSITDGVNIANSGIQTFTLSFLSPLWDETILSIGTSSTNSLDNSTFIDRSSNAHTITTAGSPVQTAFHPYLDNWSVYGGTNGVLTVPTSADFNMGNGDFTVDCWLNTTRDTGTIFDHGGNYLVTYNGIRWGWNTTTGYLKFTMNQQSNSASGEYSITGVTKVNDGQWHHLRVCRNGTTFRMFVDGVLDISGTSSVTGYQPSSAMVLLGALSNNTPTSGFANSYLLDLHMIKGTSLSTTNDSFDIPTTYSENVAGTVLHTFTSNRFVDISTYNRDITPYNTVAISAFNPFGQGSEYASGENKGSFYNLNGGNQYISFPPSAFTGVSGTAFTVEMWVYPMQYGTDYGHLLHRNWTGNNNFLWSINPSGYLSLWFGHTAVRMDNTTHKIELRQWNHIALARDGDNFAYFVNGERAQTATGAGANIDTSRSDSFYIGVYPGYNIGNTSHNAYFSDFKISDNDVYGVSNTTYTIPTSPNGNANAEIYLPMDNAGIYDKTGNHTLTLGGDTATSTTQTKFADTAMYFDGVNDYISVNDFPPIGSGDYTMEFWMNGSAVQTGTWQSLLSRDYASTDGFRLYKKAGTPELVLYSGGSAARATTVSAGLTDNTWHHVAVVRNSGTLDIYVDGVSKVSVSNSDDISESVKPLNIGGNVDEASNYPFPGYLEDVQLFIGTAKYTTNFTPPTQTQGRTYQAES